MNSDEQVLLSALRVRRDDDAPRQPDRFFQAVRARRQRVLVGRVASAAAVVLLFAMVGVFGISGLFGRSLRAIPGLSEADSLATVRTPPALQRLRELPPEVGPGPGFVNALRVLDFRSNAASAMRDL